MTQPSNKFEQLLELLINEENEKAEQLFHEIVVEKSRDIYENLADSETATAETQETATTEAKDEAKEDDKKDESVVKETEKSDEKAEDKKEETKEATTETKTADGEEVEVEKKTDEAMILQKPAVQPQKSDEESIEEIGGDATDQLVKDIASDEEGEAPAAADDMAADMDADDNGEEGSVEDRVVDLEDALDELKAEFEAMLASQNGDNGEEAEEHAIAPAPVVPAQTQPQIEAKAKEDKKETVKEYAIKKSADTSDGSDKSAKSPVATKGGAKGGGSPVKTGSGAAETGRSAPTAEKIASGFENSPAIDKSKSFSKEQKADTKDGSDKSAKSPVNAVK